MKILFTKAFWLDLGHYTLALLILSALLSMLNFKPWHIQERFNRLINQEHSTPLIDLKELLKPPSHRTIGA
jgi:hypothetical protein